MKIVKFGAGVYTQLLELERKNWCYKINYLKKKKEEKDEKNWQLIRLCW
jgi:hypothetical protein